MVATATFGERARAVSTRPLLARATGLLDAAECRHLVELSRARLPSADARVATLTRRGLRSTDPVLRALQERLAALSGRSIACLEPLWAVRCAKGQRLRGHWDADEYPSSLRRAGQRVMTIFVHLTTLARRDGGAFEFPRLGVRLQPVAGEALCWLNVTPGGRVYRDLYHGGEEVTGDVEKWGVNAWIREAPAR